jgi:hypothetical protein
VQDWNLFQGPGSYPANVVWPLLRRLSWAWQRVYHSIEISLK